MHLDVGAAHGVFVVLGLAAFSAWCVEAVRRRRWNRLRAGEDARVLLEQRRAIDRSGTNRG